MRDSSLSILLVTSQTWAQFTRLALRFVEYGCAVDVLCPPNSSLRRLPGVRRHSFRMLDPVRSLSEAIERSAPRYLVPGDDLAVWLMHELMERFPQHSQLVEASLGPSSAFPTIRSRARLLKLAGQLGIPVPFTSHVSGACAFGEWQESGKPCVLKKDGTWAGGGVAILPDANDLPRQYERLRQEAPVKARLWSLLVKGERTAFVSFPSLPQAEFSVQQYIEGAAANSMFACDAGRVLASVHTRVVASKGRTGPALMIELIDNERMEEAGRKLAAALGLSGFFGLDFVLEAGTGTPYLIELNPRCTQLGHVALAARPDLAGTLWAHWAGQPAAACGAPDLGQAIAFYPQARDWAPDCQFLARARFDVSTADLPAVDALAQTDSAPFGRASRRIAHSVRAMGKAARPSKPEPTFYFEAVF